MRQLRDNGRRFYDFLRGLAVGAQNYASSIGPQIGVTVGAIASGSNANSDVDWSAYPELLSGYYQVSAAIILEMADSTYREVRFAFSAVFAAGTLTLQGTPTPITGAWNSSGITVSVTVVSGDVLRFNVAVVGGVNVTTGDLYVSFGRRRVAA